MQRSNTRKDQSPHQRLESNRISKVVVSAKRPKDDNYVVKASNNIFEDLGKERAFKALNSITKEQLLELTFITNPAD